MCIKTLCWDLEGVSVVTVVAEGSFVTEGGRPNPSQWTSPLVIKGQRTAPLEKMKGLRSRRLFGGELAVHSSNIDFVSVAWGHVLV